MGDPIIPPAQEVRGSWVRRSKTCPTAKTFCNFFSSLKKSNVQEITRQRVEIMMVETMKMVAVVVVAAFSTGFCRGFGGQGGTFAFSCERESIVGRRRGGSTFPSFHVAGFSAR